MEMRYPFKTTTMPAIATNGVLVAIAVPAPNQFTLQTNAAQLIFYNPDLVETLYIRAYNPIADVAGVDINTCLPVTPQGYLTLSLGTRTERVGTAIVCGLTTAAASYNFTITEIYNIEE